MGALDTVKKGAKAVGNFGVGVAKGAGDTLMSVKRNVQKIPAEYTKIKVMESMNQAREAINKANEPLLKKLKELPKDDPRRAKVKELLQANQKQFAEISQQEDEIMKEIDNVTNGTIEVKDTDSWGKKLASRAQNLLNAGERSLQTTNKAQRAGFAVEKIAELVVPSTAVAKADKALKGVKIASDATRTGRVANALTQVATRAGLEAGVAGAASMGQSAYQGKLDTKEGREAAISDAKTTAATAGILKGAMVAGGQILNSVKAPQRLAQATYKSTPDEVGHLIRNEVAREAGKNVDEAETLADWAIRNNIKGSLKTQAKTLTKMADDYEKQLIETARAQNARIKVDPDFVEFLKGIKEKYSKGPFKEVVKTADDYLNGIDDVGSVDVEKTLKVKRMLDGFRSEASFRDPTIGSDIKGWSNVLRGNVNDFAEIGGINKEYSKTIQAIKAVQKKFAQNGNKQVVGALESYTAALPLLDGVGDGASNFFGAAVVAAKRAVNSPRVQMSAAQTIKNLGDSTAKGVGARAVLGRGVVGVKNSMGDNDLGAADESTDSELQFTPTPSDGYTPPANDLMSQNPPMDQLTEDDLELMGLTP